MLKKHFYVGLTGLAGSGKTTAALFLREAIGWQRFDSMADIESFAQPVKECYHSIYDDQVQDSQEWKNGMAPFGGITRRQALQKIGHGMRELLGEDVWVESLFNRTNSWNPRIYFIADVRYPNEVDAIIKAGGVVYRVQRDGVQEMEHESEQALKHRVFPVILNNGTMADLKINCREVAETLIKNIEKSCL